MVKSNTKWLVGGILVLRLDLSTGAMRKEQPLGRYECVGNGRLRSDTHQHGMENLTQKTSRYTCRTALGRTPNNSIDQLVVVTADDVVGLRLTMNQGPSDLTRSSALS